MAKRMLIDAAHPEETRIVVLTGDRLDQFDFESSTKKQLKGNIYLAKVTRVEPSLQAAFIEYGGNRHGFLSFNEIHPDYYQIPIADREALKAQAHNDQPRSEEDELDAAPDSTKAENGGATANSLDSASGDEAEDAPNRGDDVEEVGGDETEDVEKRRTQPSRRYKIQEVIKRRQILLVQVVKEERGTKGAALTSYLSLAGRYCVLMPNTARGGGISRKIINPEDRKRLRAIANDLKLTDGMGVILRTAGMERSRPEIKRDFAYLVKLWASIRARTLESIAPSLIHEEANLINRSLRDLYTSEIDEVLVEGDEGYRMAKDFMRLLIPSHARRIKAFRESTPLFHHHKVEGQIDAMHSPIVHLRSGGYVVISPTEALVAIDVNSGRATRERNIEETATKTNLEAAEEIARQLRLRDLSGLIVVDFIDMEVGRNVRTVERRFKESVKGDRARIQMGRISHFGLLELSRQRLRPSLLEASSQVCAYCGGTGHVRSTESTSLHVLRAIEEEGFTRRSSEITVYVPAAVALYILNQKRTVIREIEERYGFTVVLASDDSLIPPDYRLERVKGQPGAEDGVAETGADEEKSDRKRRRRTRGRKGEEDAPRRDAEVAEDAGAASADAPPLAASGGDDKEEESPKRRWRGKRGGRRRRRGGGDQAAAETSIEAAGSQAAAEQQTGGQAAPIDEPAGDDPTGNESPAGAAEASAAEAESAPEEPKRRRRKAGNTADADGATGEEKAAKPKRARRTRGKAAKPDADASVPADGGNGASHPGEPPADKSPTGESPASESPASESPASESPTRESPAREPAAVEVAVPIHEPEIPAAAAFAGGDGAGEDGSKQPARRGWWRRLTE